MSENETNDSVETPEPNDSVAPPEPEEEPQAVAAVEDSGDEEEERFVFAEDPVFDTKYLGDCAYEVKVTIPPANEKQQAEEMFGELKHDAELPGFRRGRAPLKLVERKFGKAVKNEVTTKLVSAAFEKLIEDEELRPIGMPDIDGLEEAGERKEGDAIEVMLKFEVAARVKLGDYEGVEIERPVVKIAASQVDEAIESIRRRFAVYEAVEDATITEGDQVSITFKGTIEGEEFQGGSAENYPYIVGSKRFFPEFEEALQGSSTGDELSCEVTFGDDYSAAHLRGRTAQFAIKVNEIKRRDMPEISDEFAKQAGFDSEDAMREQVEERLRLEGTARSEHIVRGRAAKALVEGATFEMPKGIVDHAAEAHYNDEVERLKAMRLPAARIAEREEQLRETSREAAVENLKTMVALNEAGTALNIEVTEDDFEKETAAMSANAGVTPEQVAQYIEDEGQRNSVEGRIFRAKVVEMIVAAARITDKEISEEEFVALLGEEG